jgi:hypothetical protein
LDQEDTALSVCVIVDNGIDEESVDPLISHISIVQIVQILYMIDVRHLLVHNEGGGEVANIPTVVHV